MASNRSPYAVLGLKPGADRAAVDRAYKRLIKRHHPDRAGGNAKRAAEINRAYRELRGERSGFPQWIGDDAQFAERSENNDWIRAVFLAPAGAILLLLFAAGPVTDLVEGRPATLPPALHIIEPSDRRGEAGTMDRPLSVAAIDGAVLDALRMARSEDEIALAATSRDCHHRLRLAPSLEQLDRCAAFDDAVVELQDRDPLRDQGPFSELSVTGRQMSAATMLSNDSLAIDGRLDRIRLRVELALAPTDPEPVVVNAPVGD
jgi:hypothetical protein